MTEIHNRDELFDRLTQVVGAYGADQARWPTADRQLLATLIANDDAAERLLANARVMDALLDRATGAVEAEPRQLAAMADRMMARISNEATGHPVRKADTNVIAFPEQRSGLPGQDANKIETGGLPNWMMAAALAASLVLGVFVGATGYLEQATSSVTELAGLTPVVEVVAQIEDGFGPVEEEFL